MPRAMWRGAIQFGLVTVPVKPYLATEEQFIILQIESPEALANVEEIAADL